jgi:hypothetical protein
MEFINNKCEFWQGWNEFLGIDRDDSHNYTLNLIGDILDGYKVRKRKKELLAILICDEGNSYHIKTVNAYNSINEHNESWMQVRLYKVDMYFLVMNLTQDGVSMLHYGGDNLNLAFDSFQMTIENSQAFIKNMLEVTNQSDLVMAVKKKVKIGSSDYYRSAGFEIPEYSDRYYRTLMIFLSGKYGNIH